MEGTQPDWRPSMYSPIEARRGRRLPPVTLRRQILWDQRNNCAYCTLPVTGTVIRNGSLIHLRLNWDHFVPYSYLQRNPYNNWVAACHVCNGIKSDDRFPTLEVARQVILRRREEKRYEPVSDSWRRLITEPYNEYLPPQQILELPPLPKLPGAPLNTDRLCELCEKSIHSSRSITAVYCSDTCSRKHYKIRRKAKLADSPGAVPVPDESETT